KFLLDMRNPLRLSFEQLIYKKPLTKTSQEKPRHFVESSGRFKSLRTDIPRRQRPSQCAYYLTRLELPTVGNVSRCADHKSVVGSLTPPPERERLCRVQRAKNGTSPA